MFKVCTPATTANLGSGFDILGLSLQLYNEFEVEKSKEYDFMNFDKQYSHPDHNLIVKAYRYVCKNEHKKEVPFRINIEQNIPNSRGLGSSSSLIVAGILIAEKLLDLNLSDDQKLKYATDLEGHPDNVAPCLFGGLIASFLNNETIIKHHYPLHKKVNVYLAIPDFRLSTSHARSVLPEFVSRKDCINNGFNILALLKGMEKADDTLISAGLQDFLHTRYRSELIHEFDEVIRIINSNTTISGAGPSLLTVTSRRLDTHNIQKDLNTLGNKWRFIKLNPDFKGAYVYE